MTIITIALFVVLVLFRSEIGSRLAVILALLWFAAIGLVILVSGLPLEKLFDRPWTVENERWAVARWSLLAWEVFLLVCAWCTKEYRERM